MSSEDSKAPCGAQVVVLSGTSGAGKTHYIQNSIKSQKQCVSADDYFMVDGVYKFDPKKVDIAKAHCFRQFIELVKDQISELIVVDNTNTTTEEISPYILGGEAYGYQTEVVTLIARTGQHGLYDILEYCAARNVHGTQSHVVFAQHKRIMSRALPPSWKHTLVPIVVPESQPLSEKQATSSSVIGGRDAMVQWIPKALQSTK